MVSWIFPSDDPGVVFEPLDLAKHLQCWRTDMDGLRAGLGIWQVKRRALEINVIPLEGHDLGQSASSENQKTQGIDRRLALNALLFRLSQYLSKSSKFILGQIALSFLLWVLFDVAAGIGAVGTQSPDLS